MMTASPDDVNTLLIARESITDVSVLLSFLFPLGGGNGKATVGRHNFGGGNCKNPLVAQSGCGLAQKIFCFPLYFGNFS